MERKINLPDSKIIKKPKENITNLVEYDKIDNNLNFIDNINEVIKNLNNTDKIENVTLFGAIVSQNKPIYDKEKKIYKKQLKIIDESFNYKKFIDYNKIKFRKYINISFKSINKHDLPECEKLGDIIYLKNFTIIKDKNNIIFGSDSKNSNWMIYKLEMNYSVNPYKFKENEDNLLMNLNSFEKQRIFEIRIFLDKFLFKNSLKYILWWREYEEKNTNTDIKIDFILYVSEINLNEYKLLDNKGVSYILKLKSNEWDKLKIKNVYHFKLKYCIKDGDSFNIKLFKKNSFLRLPNFMYDFRQLCKINSQKNNGEDGEFIENKKFYSTIKLEALIVEFPFIKNYIMTSKENNNFIRSFLKFNFYNRRFTTIKKEYFHTEYSSLKETLNSENEGIYKFRANLININKPILIKNTIFKKFCKICEKIKNFNDTTKKCCKKSMILIIFLNLPIKDVNSKFITELYITNMESNVFDLWRIFPQNNIDLDKISSDILDNFINKLDNLINRRVEIEFISEIKILKNKKILKLKDTVFLP